MAVAWGRATTTADDVKAAADSGFDGAELPVGFFAEMSDREFSGLSRSLRDSGLRFDVFSSILPPAVRVTEPGFNIYVWSEYLKRALDRIAGLGGRTLVWSDGRARVLPEEGEVAAQKRQALQFLFMLSELAESHGMYVLVEPLDPRRTNFLNTMAQVKEFLLLAGEQNLASAISLRDLQGIGFGSDDFGTYSDLISHVYVENPFSPAGTRAAPRPDDGHDYGAFFTSLRDIGYSGTITLPHDADAASLEFCRRLLTD